MNILTAGEMRAADEHAIRDLGIPALRLMENAAEQFVRVLTAEHPQPLRVLVVCGKGNNGGDGSAVARLLQGRGWSATAVMLDAASDLKADAAENWARANRAGVLCLESKDDLSPFLAECDLVVDALFGTGLTKALEGRYSKAVEALNGCRKQVWAVDVPSGAGSDSGELIGPTVRAYATVALASLKHCHLFFPLAGFCGALHAVDIGIPTESKIRVVRAKQVLESYPRREAESHKGTFGHAVVIAGSSGKSGAAYLCAKSALRAGAGLVTAICPSSIQSILASLGPEIMTSTPSHSSTVFGRESASEVAEYVKGKSAVAIGPGMGTEESSLLFLNEILPQIAATVVLDADGLNLVAEDPALLKLRPPLSTILTPHPAEMGRLLGIDTKSVQSDRIGAARNLARETGAIVVLKGARTLIATPDDQVFINPTGSPALASAGTGDVLTGVITGLLAQGLPPLEAAIAGVYTHGFAGNLFSREFPQQALNAMDIPALWNRTVREIMANSKLENEYLNFHFAF